MLWLQVECHTKDGKVTINRDPTHSSNISAPLLVRSLTRPGYESVRQVTVARGTTSLPCNLTTVEGFNRRDSREDGQW